MTALVVVEMSRAGATFLRGLLERQLRGGLAWPSEGRLSSPYSLEAFRGVLRGLSSPLGDDFRSWRVAWMAEPGQLLEALRLLDEAYFSLRLSSADRALLVGVKKDIRSSL